MPIDIPGTCDFCGASPRTKDCCRIAPGPPAPPSRGSGYRVYGKVGSPPSVGKWWCPTCQLLVEQPTNPITCAECEGDMTMAPARAVGKA